MVAKMPKAGGGEMMLLKSPHKFSKTPPEIPGPAAALGQHTSEILRTVCGYSDEKIRALKESAIVVETQPD
jgi:crotonobetainyl-CoA:carnitine CoA-transferase CaiB-like acyl-CoA transferase